MADLTAEQFAYITRGLTHEEIEFYIDAATVMHQVPLSLDDAVQITYTTYIELFKPPAHEHKQLAASVRHYLEVFPGISYLHRNTAPFQKVLHAHNLTCTAVPVIHNCLKCKRPCTHAGFEQRETYFFDIGDEGKRGKLYLKECRDCGITYQLDKYQDSKHYKHGGGVKRMYRAEDQHPKWFRCAGESRCGITFMLYCTMHSRWLQQHAIVSV